MKLPPIRVAVIDSGWKEEDSGGSVEEGTSFFRPGEPFECDCVPGARDLIGHGTVCIRIIHAIAPAATVCPLRVFGRKLETSPEVLIAALTWAIDKQFDVVSLSLNMDREDWVATLYDRCADLYAGGTTIVAASGKNEQTSYPASFDNVIGVSVAELNPITTNVSSQIDFTLKRNCIANDGRFTSLPPINCNSYAAALIAGCVADERSRLSRPNLSSIAVRLASSGWLKK